MNCSPTNRERELGLDRLVDDPSKTGLMICPCLEGVFPYDDCRNMVWSTSKTCCIVTSSVWQETMLIHVKGTVSERSRVVGQVLCLIGCVRFTRHCGKMYSRHLFSYGGNLVPRVFSLAWGWGGGRPIPKPGKRPWERGCYGGLCGIHELTGVQISTYEITVVNRVKEEDNCSCKQCCAV